MKKQPDHEESPDGTGPPLWKWRPLVVILICMIPLGFGIYMNLTNEPVVTFTDAEVTEFAACLLDRTCRHANAVVFRTYNYRPARATMEDLDALDNNYGGAKILHCQTLRARGGPDGYALSMKCQVTRGSWICFEYGSIYAVYVSEHARTGRKFFITGYSSRCAVDEPGDWPGSPAGNLREIEN